MDVIGAMSENLRAVPWFAEMEPEGGGRGGVVEEGGRGEERTVPKRAKSVGTRGTAWILMVCKDAIVEDW